MNNRPTLRRCSLAGLMALCVGAGSVRAVADDTEATQARNEIGARIEELGTTLKAAAMSGAITGEEARAIYGRVAKAAKAAYERDFGGGGKETEITSSPKAEVIRLIAPRPARTRVLLQPEFLRRDLQLLRDELELDRDQLMIVEVLFDEYARAYELAAAPLKEAIVRYRSVTLNTYIAFALEEADVKLEAAVESVRRVDREEAVARMTETLARIDREKSEGLASAPDADRARYDAWKGRMIAAVSELDDRLAAIRERTKAQLAGMGRADAAITADDLVRMAKQLRSDRMQLRRDVTESIETIANDAQRGEEDALFDAAMARIRIGQLLPQGRLGGESMNLWAALAETSRNQASASGRNEPLEHAASMLEGQAPEIAARLDERTEAVIDREIAGLELRSLRDQIAAANGESVFEVDERRLVGVIRPYADALRREVSTSVAARDALRALLDGSSAYIRELAPDTELATEYREASLRRGFPVETRRRWTERVMTAALGLEDLNDEVLQALLILDAQIATELQTLRERAIAGRIQRDPKLARDFIRSEFEGVDIELDEDVWRELEHAAFAALDDRTESQLRGILRPEQLARLPARKREDAWGDGTAKGKGEGKGTNDGKGTSDGKGKRGGQAPGKPSGK